VSDLTVLTPEVAEHDGGDRTRPVLVWRFPAPVLTIATGMLGGGLGGRSWVVNVEVPITYERTDVAEHLGQVAAGAGCRGSGVGLVTAARVLDFTTAADRDVEAVATVGLQKPTWAADDDDSWSEWSPGTINVVAWVPVPLADAALTNAAVTLTEAKAQALMEGGVPGTGTASDALCVCCPVPDGDGEPFAGPRSVWGGRLARAVRAAVAAGVERYGSLA